MTITPDTVVRRALDARARKIRDSFLIAQADDVRELNDVAARIWALTDGRRSAREVAQTLEGEFDAPAEDLLADVLEFLTEMVDARLMVERTADE